MEGRMNGHEEQVEGMATSYFPRPTTPGVSKAPFLRPRPLADMRPPLVGEEAQLDAHTVSNFAAFSLVINYIIGIAILDMPYVFHGSGYVMGMTTILMTTVLSTISLAQLIEVLRRTEHRFRFGRGPLPEGETVHRAWEISELCEIYLGHAGEKTYNIFMCGFFGVALWAFAAACGTSIGALAGDWLDLPCDTDTIQAGVLTDWTICPGLYRGCTLIWGLFVLLMSQMELKEQARWQWALTVYRLVVMTLLVVLSVFGLSKKIAINGDPHVNSSSPWNWGGFTRVWIASAMAQNPHHSLPGLVHTVKSRDDFPIVFGGALAVTGGFYIAVGMVCAAYFGQDIEALVTLNFDDFNGFGGDGFIPHLALLAKYFIILMPVIDLTSIFALSAVTFGNNVMSSFPKILRIRLGEKNTRRICRVICCLIPLLAALVMSDIAQVIQIMGTVGFVPTFIVPGLLLYCSRQGVKGYRRVHFARDRSIIPAYESDLSTSRTSNTHSETSPEQTKATETYLENSCSFTTTTSADFPEQKSTLGLQQMAMPLITETAESVTEIAPLPGSPGGYGSFIREGAKSNSFQKERERIREKIRKNREKHGQIQKTNEQQRIVTSQGHPQQKKKEKTSSKKKGSSSSSKEILAPGLDDQTFEAMFLSGNVSLGQTVSVPPSIAEHPERRERADDGESENGVSSSSSASSSNIETGSDGLPSSSSKETRSGESGLSEPSGVSVWFDDEEEDQESSESENEGEEMEQTGCSCTFDFFLKKLHAFILQNWFGVLLALYGVFGFTYSILYNLFLAD